MVVIIDYDMGNVSSVAKAFKRLGLEVCISSGQDDIRKAEYIVLPGVGAFGKGMENLRLLGLVDILEQEVLHKKKPFLGICLGMQLLAKESYENGLHKGLGWFDAEVIEFDPRFVRVPHMGWNDVYPIHRMGIFSEIQKNPVFYFAHSFYMRCYDESIITAQCDYNGMFVAAIQKENIFATQFHPEKSQDTGLKLLQNFIDCGVKEITKKC